MTAIQADIKLSDSQADGVRKIVHWFKNDSRKQQIYRVFGFGGTGKSTIVSYALSELGLKIGLGTGDKFALAATYTAKASLVLRKKNTPCQTIHSLIYRVFEATPESIEAKKKLINKLAVNLQKATPSTREKISADLGREQLTLKDMMRPQFSLNEESVLRDASLLIVDEVSMVSEPMARDLMSFEKPILVLGDPGQLPPIRGEGFFMNAMPDIFLSEIHRQALDNPIIRLSMMARDGQYINYGEYSSDVMKLPRNSLTAHDMLKADQCLSGFNATRIQLNNAMQKASGYTEWFPTGKGEKIIALKNINDIGIINGGFLKLEKCSPVRDGRGGVPTMIADVTTDEDINVGEKQIYLGHFQDHIELDKERDFKDRFHKKGMIECVWGSCITTHKSQGSSWPRVILYDDGFGRSPDDRKRFLYTAITHAEEGLVILA